MNTINKYCAVPMCDNTSYSTPDRIFVNLPKNKETRKKWLTIASRDPATYKIRKSNGYFCEDHFDIQNDMENYMEYRIMGKVSRIVLRRGCLPSKFACQSKRPHTPATVGAIEYLGENKTLVLQHSENSIINVPNTSSGSGFLPEWDEKFKIDMTVKIEECELEDPTGKELEFQETSGDMKQCPSSIKSEYDGILSGCSIGAEFHLDSDEKFEAEKKVKIEECELGDPIGDECLNLELQEKPVNVKQCTSSVKSECDDIKLEEQESTINNEDATVKTGIEKLAPRFESQSESGNGQEHVSSQKGSGALFKCEDCGYQCKNKRNFNRHLLVHKDPSEVEIYKCNECSYKSKYKFSLKNHKLVHEDPSQVQMFKCNHCSFETRHKYSLKLHGIVHQGPAMFQCDKCSYRCKRKSDLNKHMLVHEDPSHIQTFKCNDCSYQAKRKGDLRLHLLVHRDPSRVQMFKCNECSYESKRKRNLNEHKLTHLDPSSLPKFKCNKCSYETIHKRRLKEHMWIHTDLPKGGLEQFMLVHEGSSQFQLIKCNDLNKIRLYKPSGCTFTIPSSQKLYLLPVSATASGGLWPSQQHASG